MQQSGAVHSSTATLPRGFPWPGSLGRREITGPLSTRRQRTARARRLEPSKFASASGSPAEALGLGESPEEPVCPAGDAGHGATGVGA